MANFNDLRTKADKIYNIKHAEEIRENVLTAKLKAFAKDIRPLSDILGIAELHNSIVIFDNIMIEIVSAPFCSEEEFMVIRNSEDTKQVRIPYDIKVIDKDWGRKSDDTEETIAKNEKECFDMVETVLNNSEAIAELLTNHTSDLLDEYWKKLEK